MLDIEFQTLCAVGPLLSHHSRNFGCVKMQTANLLFMYKRIQKIQIQTKRQIEDLRINVNDSSPKIFDNTIKCNKGDFTHAHGV